MDKNVVQLAIDSMHGTVNGNFSAKETSETLRKAFIDANGGSTKINMRTFHRGNALFDIVEELIPYLVEDGLRGDEAIFNLVDYRNIALGDENRFWTEDKSDFVVAKIAEGSTSVRRQRLNVGQYVNVPTQLYAIKVYEEMNRLLAGRIDFNTLVERVGTSWQRYLRTMIATALEGVTATSVGMNATYVKSGTFAVATLRELIDHVEAATGKTAHIIGTRAGLAKVIDTSANGIALAASSMKEDIYNSGFAGRFYGTPMIAIKQAHKVGTDVFAINDNKIYVVAGDDKPIKVVNEGDGLLIERNELEQADLTREYLMAARVGVGAIFNEKMGIYTMS